MIISHANRFIFLKTQKCAGTSIELALTQVCGPDDVITVGPEDEKTRVQLVLGPQNCTIPQEYRPLDWRLRKMLGLRSSWAGSTYFNHMPASKLRRSMDRHLFDAYRKVTVVRNPWDREVSLYFWRYRNSKDRPSFESFVRIPRYRPERKTFELYSINGTVVADTVLRYENLEKDFADFIATLGTHKVPELPRAKGKYRSESSRDYRNLYSAAAQRIVARRYAREIEAFGYEF
jgi:sulfotransferase famil protein